MYTEVVGERERQARCVTDLTNRAMPLIRYQIGDVVVPSDRVLHVRPRAAADRARRGPRGRLRRSRRPGGSSRGISLTENFALLIPGTAQVQIVQESLHRASHPPRARRRLRRREPPARSRNWSTRRSAPSVRYDVELVDAIPQEAVREVPLLHLEGGRANTWKAMSGMTPRVSVVMAAKNYARFLPAAVESVLAQTFADWELLIIDDGSTDDTPEAVRPFLADPRVRYFRSDRLGQPRAKNLGIGLSRGEFVAFLDADDAWLPTKLEKQLALFARRPGRRRRVLPRGH